MMTKKERVMVKALENRCAHLEPIAAAFNTLAALLMDSIREEVRQIAEEEADIAVENLQVTR